MQRQLAIVIAAVAIALVLVNAQFKRPATPQAFGKPEDPVWAMFQAAKDGNVQAYLNCFADEIRARLDREAQEMRPERFGGYLRQGSKDVLGIAVSDLEKLREDEARMRVELTFRDRNEVQKFAVRKLRNGWKIKDMTEAQRVKPVIPYGTKVFE
ncbi:MAG: hypothetical protein FJ279_03420 [Planctomycetes bacterium]|nr:hypothetical protein [Planctomycetota bacterium]MBM4083217.1 hypothetical protein [Planctomycetota bacterium]